MARAKKLSKETALGAAVLIVLAFCGAQVQAESFDSLTAKARIAQAQGRAAQALAEISQALKLWTKADGQKPRARALADKAALEYAVGEFDAAIYDLSAAVRIDKKHPDYFYRLGRLYLREAQNSAAIGEFYKAVALNINYKEAYYARGQAYARLGNRDFARQDYRQACSLGLREACDALDVSAPLKRRRKMISEAYARCRNFLSDCTYQGASFSQCVKRARPRASDFLGVCCPQDCLSQFWNLLQSQSEAAAYAEIFNQPYPACAGIP